MEVGISGDSASDLRMRLSVRLFSAESGELVRFPSTGVCVCGALATDQALGLGKPGTYMARSVPEP